jgi:hypothetical protein
MIRRLFRLTATLALCVSSYGLLLTPSTQACACSCTYVCPNTCNLSCEDCSLSGLIETGARCCSEEKGRTDCNAN